MSKRSPARRRRDDRRWLERKALLEEIRAKGRSCQSCVHWEFAGSANMPKPFCGLHSDGGGYHVVDADDLCISWTNETETK